MINKQRGGSLITLLIIIAVAGVAYWLGATYGQDKIFNLPGDLGEIIEQDREVADFSKIVIKGCGNVNLSQGEEEVLKVKTNEKIIEYVKTEVRDNTLYLEYDANWANQICGFFSDAELNYDLKVINLDKVEIQGSGSIIASDIKTTNMEIFIDGSGNVEMQLEAEKLTGKIEGSGRIKPTGTVNDQDVSIYGSGNYLGLDLVSKKANLVISGSGKVEVNAENELDIVIEGSGDVYYSGNPAIDQTIVGSGNIRSLK